MTDLPRVQISDDDVAQHQEWARASWQRLLQSANIDLASRRELPIMPEKRIEYQRVQIDAVNSMHFKMGLRGVVLRECQIDSLSARGSFLKNSDFSGSAFNDAVLDGACLAGTSFRNCQLNRVDLMRTDLIWDGEEADFSGAVLLSCDLSGAKYNYKGHRPKMQRTVISANTALPCGIDFGLLVSVLLPRYVEAKDGLVGLKDLWTNLEQKIHRAEAPGEIGAMVEDHEVFYSAWVDLIIEHDKKYRPTGAFEPQRFPVPPEHVGPLRDLAWLFDKGALGSLDEIRRGVTPWMPRV